MRTVRQGALFGLSAGIIFAFFSVATVLIGQALTSFQAGELVSAAKINENFDFLKNRAAPIGGIMAWHKNYTGSLTLTDGWIECNGQVINDTESPFNGMTAPNLNGDAAGADSPGTTGKFQMFLRGSTTSGTGQMDAFQGHHHAGVDVHDQSGDVATDINFVGAGVFWNRNFKGDPITGNHGTARVATETRPVNMSVVWVMRIK